MTAFADAFANDLGAAKADVSMAKRELAEIEGDLAKLEAYEPESTDKSQTRQAIVRRLDEIENCKTTITRAERWLREVEEYWPYTEWDA